MREHQQGLNGEGSHFCCQIYNPSFSPDCPKLVKLPYLSVFYSFRLRSLFSSTTQMPSNNTSHMKSLLISSGIVNYSPSQSRAFLPEHFVCSLGHNPSHHISLWFICLCPCTCRLSSRYFPVFHPWSCHRTQCKFSIFLTESAAQQ